MTAGSEAAASARIRARLKMTPGARTCGIGGCTVITQGGNAGLTAHRKAVHPGEQWLDNGTTEDK